MDERDCETGDGMVTCENACPTCGERNMDNLIWIDDDEVTCQTCKTIYQP